MQLLLFQKETPRSMWQYMSCYKADDQAQMTSSENCIRNLWGTLSTGKPDLQWAVVASDDPVAMFRFSVGGRNNRRGKKMATLNDAGTVVLEFSREGIKEMGAVA